MSLNKRCLFKRKSQSVSTNYTYVTIISVIGSTQHLDIASNTNIKMKMLSTRFRSTLRKKVSLSGDYTFYKKKGRYTRKPVTKSQKWW